MRKDQQKLQTILFDAYIGRHDEVEEELKACGIEPDQAEKDARMEHVFPKKQLTTEEFLAEMAAHKAKKEAAAARTGNGAAAEVVADGGKPASDAAEYKEVYVRKSARSAASNVTGRKMFRRSLTAVATIAVVATAILGVSVLFCEPVGADRDRTEHEGKYGDMHVISQGQMTDFVADNTYEASTKAWEDVESQKEFLPELKIPGFVPDGYDFVLLKIVKQDDVTGERQYRYKAEYQFEREDKCFGIVQQYIGDEESVKTFIETSYEKIVSGDFIIYVQYYQESDTYTAVYFEEHQSVSVVGNITKFEAIEVIKNFR